MTNTGSMFSKSIVDTIVELSMKKEMLSDERCIVIEQRPIKTNQENDWAYVLQSENSIPRP